MGQWFNSGCPVAQFTVIRAYHRKRWIYNNFLQAVENWANNEKRQIFDGF